jgi:hypothetical protein
MNASICFACGAEKWGALNACGSCKAIPETESELALSLALSNNLSSKNQLLHFGHEIRNHKKRSVPEELLAQAHEALTDPQLIAMLGDRQQPAQPPPAERITSSEPTSPPPLRRPLPRQSAARRKRSLKETSLHRNPFALLGATTRDGRRRIVELAEEKSLEADHDACQKARSDLTGPRTRLSAEIAWLPGISPRKASQLVETLLEDPMSIRLESGLPTLAHLNLLAAAFEGVDSSDTAEDVAEFIQEMAYLADDLSAGKVMRDINEDRSVCSFPEVRASDHIEAELTERKRYYRNAIMVALNNLTSASPVEAMTLAVNGATSGGKSMPRS